MKNKISLIILLAGLLIVASACQEDPVVLVSPEIPETMPTNVSRSETGWDDPHLHAEFEEIWAMNTNVEYMMVEGHIDLRTGGELIFPIPQWGPEYEVRLKLGPRDESPGTLDGPDGVILRVAIPLTNESGIGFPTYEFYPDGIEFPNGIEVTLCIPTWVDSLRADNTYELVTIAEDWHDSQRHFIVTDRQSAMPAAVQNADPGVTEWTRAERATNITYTLNHFSRWGVSSGTDDSPPTILEGVEPTEGCWIMAPPPVVDPWRDQIKIY